MLSLYKSNFFNTQTIISFFFYQLLFFVINASDLQIDSKTFPTAYTLLSQDFVIVFNDGIHFYSSSMIEDESKKIIFERQINSLEESDKTTITQFPTNYKGYILVLANDIIYFFKHDGIFINSADLTDSISSSHYFLVPYKADNDYLYYIISFPIDQKSFSLLYCKFSLNFPNSNNILETKIIEPMIQSETKYEGYVLENLSGPSCIFISPAVLVREILACFYAIRYPIEVQIRAFDPDDNFNELTEYFRYTVLTLSNFYFSTYLSAVIDENKEKVHIFMVESSAYIMDFDYSNSFSEPLRFTEHSYQDSYRANKLYYLRQTHEYVFAALTLTCCKIYIVHFSSNLEVKYEGEISPSESCYGTNTFSLVLYANQLTILIDDKINIRIIIYKLNEIGIIENIEEPISNYDFESNELKSDTIISIIPSTIIFTTVPTTIITTYIKIPTTIITTFIEVPTTILTTFFEIPSTILTTFIEVPTSILTTFIEAPTIPTIIKTEINIPSTIITTHIDTYKAIKTTYFETNNSTTIITAYTVLFQQPL